MNYLKLTIIGNSVGLRIRPPKNFPFNLSYSQQVERLISKKEIVPIVRNMSFSRALISEIVLKKEEYIKTYPHYFIINVGVCDASNRPIPLWIANLIKRKKIPIISFLLNHIYSNLIKPHISFWVKLRGKRPWISLEKFKKNYKELIKYILKETNSKIIVIPINPTTERVERIIPGSRKNFSQFNKVIEEISNTYKLFSINLDELQSKVHCPDGIHYSYEGNLLIANKIMNIIEKKCEQI